MPIVIRSFFDCNGGRLHRSELTASTGLQEEFASLAGLNGKIAA
jgi:hypothetical protein